MCMEQACPVSSLRVIALCHHRSGLGERDGKLKPSKLSATGAVLKLLRNTHTLKGCSSIFPDLDITCELPKDQSFYLASRCLRKPGGEEQKPRLRKADPGMPTADKGCRISQGKVFNALSVCGLFRA